MKDHLSKVPISSNAIFITKQNHLHLSNKYEAYINNPTLWHKVTVFKCGLPRNSLLKTILKYVHPFDFIPVCFYNGEGNAYFFLRNCSNAINKLCTELTVPNPSNENEPFKMMITLGYCSTSNSIVKVEDNIVNVLKKRYNPDTKFLELDNFHEDPGLKEFCVLSQSQILNYVLLLSRKFDVHHLSLKDNNIYCLNAVSEFGNMKTLDVLDLRKNLINDLSELNIIQNLKVFSLFLEGNPLCDGYTNVEYTTVMQEKFPSLIFLDGIKFNGHMKPISNYLCNISGYQLVDQFMEHYFTLYDSSIRSVLGGLYDQNAIFSFSSSYDTSILDNSLSTIPNFFDLRTADKCAIVGTDNIINVLMKFPKSRHDPYSFTVDLVYYTDETTVLTITGRFKQLTHISLGVHGILHFARTFVLTKKAYNEYKILNDIWLITNPTAIEIEKRFQCARNENGEALKHQKFFKSPNIVVDKETDKDLIVMAFGKITTVNLYWSIRFLEHHNYNLQNTLNYFVQMYELDNIPSEAFIADTEISKNIEVLQTTVQPLCPLPAPKILFQNKSKKKAKILYN